MNSSSLRISIEVDDNGSVKLKQFGQNAEASGRSATSSFDHMNRSLTQSIGLVGSLVSAYKLAGAIKDVAMLAARHETLGVVMGVVGNNAGFMSTRMNTYAAALEKTGISMIESQSNLTKMVQAHLDLSKATELARIAQDAAVIGNMNSSEAFAHMIYGIQSGQVEVLRTIGINVNFENSYKAVAAQLKKTADNLTESEKATARMNAVLASGPAIAGAYEAAMDTAGKQVLSMTRYLDDLQVLSGEIFTPALTLVVEQITDALKAANKELKDNKSVAEDWGMAIRLAVIASEAEIVRLAMLIDKVGGTMTGVMSYLALPGAIVGNDAYKQWAAWNEDYKKRYQENEKLVQSLANKYEKTIADNAPEVKLAKEIAKAETEKKRILAGLANQAVPTTAGTGKTKKPGNHFSSIEDVYGVSPQSSIDAFDAIRDEWQKLTLSAYDYKMLNIAQWFDQETIALGGQNDQLDALRRNREQIAALEESGRRAKFNLLLMPTGYDSDSFQGMPAADKRAAKMIEEATKNSDDLIRLSQRTAEAMEKNFSDLFFDGFTGKLNTLDSFFKGVMNSVYRIFSDYMGQMAREALFGKDNTSGLVSILGEAIGSYFSGSMTDEHPGSYASGGGYRPGSVFWTGERGPELNFASQGGGGHILNHSDSMRYARTTGIKVPGYAVGTASLPAAQPPKVTVNIQNNTGGQVQGTPKIDFDMQGLVLSLVLDGMDRDVDGFRTRMGGR